MKLQLFVLLSTLLFFLSVSSAPTEIPRDVGKGEELIRTVLKGIELKNKKKIESVFEDSFVYEGCTKKYDKKEAVTFVSAVSLDMAMVLEKNAKILFVGDHKYTATIAEQFNPINSEFVVSKDWKLASGRSVMC